MVEQLLWIEFLTKVAVGIPLLLTPRVLAHVLGLPPAESPFWPRLIGGLLIGLAMAALIEVRFKSSMGLGLAGAVAMNVATAATIGSLLIMGQGGPTRRGHFTLWLVAAVLMIQALVEIAWLG